MYLKNISLKGQLLYNFETTDVKDRITCKLILKAMQNYSKFLNHYKTKKIKVITIL